MQRLLLVALTLCGFTVLSRAADIRPNPNRNVTFLSTSDCHYRTADNRQNNDWSRETLEQMNSVTDMTWPEKLGGGAIEKPRGVVVLGDCIDDGDKVVQGKSWSAEQYQRFIADFGLDGADGFLKHPVFEGWGNHDGPPAGREKGGFSFQANLKQRNEIRKQKGLISNVSENGLHYSWDWDDVHFVQLNIYPADKQNPKIRYSPEWHDPQHALAFMKQDLAKNVGGSGRPVVLMSHAGFDSDWWPPEDWQAAYEAAKPYNVILYLYGHTGTGLKDWAPEGEKKWTCINDGNTTAGFFAIQIQGDRLRAAYRTRENLKFRKLPDNKVERQWDRAWGWRWLLEKRIPSRQEGA